MILDGVRSRHAALSGTAIIAAVLLFAVLERMQADTPVLPLSGLRFPMEHYPDGTIRTLIHARRAEAPPGKPVTAEGVTVTIMQPDGIVETTLVMQDCIIDRERQTAESAGDVMMERPGAVITGKGMTWSGADEKILIKSNVKVVLSRSSDAKNLFSIF